LTAKDRRGHIINEIINTEQDFTKDMKIMLQEFHDPLVLSGTISPSEATTIFGEIGELVKINEALLQKLLVRKENSENISDMLIGDLYLEFFKKLIRYKEFCVRYQDSINFVRRLEDSNPKFRIFLTRSWDNPALRGLNLMGFMIKPISRVCKYPLLMRELLGHTTESSPDYKMLKQAENEVAQVITDINSTRHNHLKVSEEASKVKLDFRR